jgi:hypothetical protein
MNHQGSQGYGANCRCGHCGNRRVRVPCGSIDTRQACGPRRPRRDRRFLRLHGSGGVFHRRPDERLVSLDAGDVRGVRLRGDDGARPGSTTPSGSPRHSHRVLTHNNTSASGYGYCQFRNSSRAIQPIATARTANPQTTRESQGFPNARCVVVVYTANSAAHAAPTASRHATTSDVHRRIEFESATPSLGTAFDTAVKGLACNSEAPRAPRHYGGRRLRLGIPGAPGASKDTCSPLQCGAAATGEPTAPPGTPPIGSSASPQGVMTRGDERQPEEPDRRGAACAF